jgi:glutathione S-transferase
MKLYSFDGSPYGAKVHIQIALKNLKIPIEAPPWPLKSQQFNENYPLRMLPVLELDNGESIGESWAILEYLEDVSSDLVKLRPDDPLERAQMQMLARYSDTHLASQGLSPIFKTLFVPGSGNAQALFPKLIEELEKGDYLLSKLPAYRERNIHLGDISLAPIFLYTKVILSAFDAIQKIEHLDILKDWFLWINTDEAIKPVLDRTEKAASALIDQLMNH